MIAVDIRDVSKSYKGAVALSGVTLQIRAGCIVGLAGPNGSGKSTLMRLLSGLTRPTTGSIEWNITPAQPLGLGYVAQAGNLYEDLSAFENLEFLARARHIPVQQRAASITAAIEAMSLGAHTHRIVGALSHGWRQRVAIAGALIHDPPGLLLDEVTAGVDAQAREQIWSMLRALKQRGRTIIISTHLAEELHYCDEVILLNEGKVQR